MGPGSRAEFGTTTTTAMRIPQPFGHHSLAHLTLSLRAQAAYGPQVDDTPGSTPGGSSVPFGSILLAAARQEVEGGALLVAALTRCMLQPKRSAHSDLDLRYCHLDTLYFDTGFNHLITLGA